MQTLSNLCVLMVYRSVLLSSHLNELPSTPRRQHFVSRDDRFHVQALAQAGHSRLHRSSG
jgi:hypothetical protein